MTEEVFPFAPKSAIERWQKQELPGLELMRCLISYQEWMIPVAEAAVAEMLQRGENPRIVYNTDPQGVSRLLIFSDADAYRQFSEGIGISTEQHFLTTMGSWIFRLPLEVIDFVAINPFSPHEIAYGKEHFPRLKQMAEAIQVEEALRGLRTGNGNADDLLPIVRDYKTYRVPAWRTAQGLQMAMAPDSQGRVLAAVFTCDDTMDAYSAQIPAPETPDLPLQLTLTGTELFTQLLKMQLDGVVFNCSGPQPIAFALHFAQVVLDSQPGT